MVDKKIDDTSSYLNITIYPHDIEQYPSFAKPIIYHLYIKPSLYKYLSSVLKGFQWNITTNERVKKINSEDINGFQIDPNICSVVLLYNYDLNGGLSFLTS